MRTLLIAGLLLPLFVQAREIKCPAFYPEKEITLAEMPPGHNGSGLLRGAELSSAFIYIGELHSDPSMNQTMQEVPTKVKGGWDMVYDFNLMDTGKWLVCVYGGDRDSVDRPRLHGRIEWWKKIEPAKRSCVLRFREIKKPFANNWTATAVCK